MVKKKRLVPSDYKIRKTNYYTTKAWEQVEKMQKILKYKKREIVDMAIKCFYKTVKDYHLREDDDAEEILGF